MSESVAIVTGASQGIGRATAMRLARDFSALVLVARNRANLEQTAEAVKAVGAQALVIDADLGRPEAARAVVEVAGAAFGRIDALLIIAGAVPQIDLFEMTDAQWEDGLALKLHGARRVTIAAWPALKAANGAVVPDVREFGVVPEGALRRSRYDQRRDRRSREGVLRPWDRRWRAGQQRPAWSGDDRSAAVVPSALGAAARRDRRGGDRQLPEGGRHCPLR